MSDVDKESVADSDARPSILIVDDDPVFRNRLSQALRDRGYEVRAAADAEAAMGLARGESPELAVVDLRMPGRSGLELVRELKSIDASTRIVVLTGYGSIATAVEAVRLGAQDYLTKPADLDVILAALARTADDKKAIPNDFQVPSLARTEWEHIHRVLTDCDGNVSEAARKLGIHRRSLQRKLNRYPPRA
ncbi:MAG TPA: response regulator [Polyangiaceae bacterium]|jgi:two-component system response regulator RegA